MKEIVKNDQLILMYNVDTGKSHGYINNYDTPNAVNYQIY